MPQSLCPANNRGTCGAANPNQRTLHEHELEKITGLAREIIDKSHSAKRCQHCGVVYVTELKAIGPDRVLMLGHLDAMDREGWVPFDSYK